MVLKEPLVHYFGSSVTKALREHNMFNSSHLMALLPLVELGMAERKTVTEFVLDFTVYVFYCTRPGAFGLCRKQLISRCKSSYFVCDDSNLGQICKVSGVF